MAGDLVGIAGLAGISIFLLTILIIWDLIWKGIALWKSARNDQNVWFIFLLIINSIGILPIIYLIWFQKKKKAFRRDKRK